MAESGVCDFCGTQVPPCWWYPAADFEMTDALNASLVAEGAAPAPVRWGSAGEWAACPECYLLIEVNEWGALLDRTMATSALASIVAPAHRATVRALLGELHARVRRERRAAPV